MSDCKKFIPAEFHKWILAFEVTFGAKYFSANNWRNIYFSCFFWQHWPDLWIVLTTNSFYHRWASIDLLHSYESYTRRGVSLTLVVHYEEPKRSNPRAQSATQEWLDEAGESLGSRHHQLASIPVVPLSMRHLLDLTDAGIAGMIFLVKADWQLNRMPLFTTQLLCQFLHNSSRNGATTSRNPRPEENLQHWWGNLGDARGKQDCSMTQVRLGCAPGVQDHQSS